MAIVDLRDNMLSADGLAAKYAGCPGHEHPKWTLERFLRQQIPEDTQSYWEWVEMQVHQPVPASEPSPDGWSADRELNAELLATKHGTEHPHYTHDNWVADVVAHRTCDGYWSWVVDRLSDEPEPAAFSQQFQAEDIAVQCGWRQCGTVNGHPMIYRPGVQARLQGPDAWQQAVWHELHHSGYLVDGVRQKFYPSMEE